MQFVNPRFSLSSPLLNSNSFLDAVQPPKIASPMHERDMEPAIGRVPAHLKEEDYFDSPYYSYDDEDYYYLYPDELEGSGGRMPANAHVRKPDAPQIWPASLDVHRSMDRDISGKFQTEGGYVMEPVELDIVYTKQQWELIQR